jgi:hypothetical protein
MTEYNYEPLSFAGVLAHGWRLTLRTVKSGGTVALGVLLPLGMAMDHFAKGFYQALAKEFSTNPNIITDPEAMVLAVGTEVGAGLSFLSIIYLLALVYVQVVLTTVSWEATGGYHPGIGDAVRGSFGRRFRYGLLQSFLVFMIIQVGSLALEIFRGFGRGVAPMFEAVAMVAMMMAVSYFSVVTTFRVHEIVVDDRGPWRGLISSIALVRGSFWRLAGLLLVIGTLSIILAGVVPGLVNPTGVWGSFASLAALLVDFQNQTETATFLADYASSYALASSLVQRAAIPIAFLIGINLLTAMYVDLRVRRGDFDEPEALTPALSHPSTGSGGEGVRNGEE